MPALTWKPLHLVLATVCLMAFAGGAVGLHHYMNDPDRSEPYPPWLIYVGLIPESYSELQMAPDSNGVLRPVVKHRLRWFFQ